WGYLLYLNYVSIDNQEQSSFQITVKDTFPEGGEMDLVNWVPDMSQKEFVKAMVKLFGWTMQTDAYENRVKITLFNAVLRNRAIAKDWTDKRDFTEVPAVAYRFGDFGQRN